MVELVQPEDPLVWHHPEPLEIIHHHTQLYGPPGDQSVRRFKTRDTNHWYLFNRSGLAVARIEPETWAKALAGI